MNANWSEPPAPLRLTAGEVHVWRARLDRGSDEAQRLGSALAHAERARAARFVFDRDRERFVAARAILRDIAGRYLGRAAAGIEFDYEPDGKPRLRPDPSDPPLQFNVSHSGALAVYAFALGREVGVDVECIRAGFSREGIAERFFSATEQADLQALPPALRDEAFFLCWTRKEAYVKALGGGLGIALDSFDVSLTPCDGAARLVSADAARWTLRPFEPGKGYAGAVVAEGADWTLRLWDWDWRP